MQYFWIYVSLLILHFGKRVCVCVCVRRKTSKENAMAGNMGICCGKGRCAASRLEETILQNPLSSISHLWFFP